MSTTSVRRILSEEMETAPTHWKPTRQELMIMITLSVLSLMVSLDASIIVTSLSAIIDDLGTDISRGAWIGTSYLLANAVSMPPIATLSEVFGRSACLVASISLFTMGTLLCCLAPSIGVLLVGRCFQGVGGGGIMILGLVIFTDIVPLRFRPKWYGIVLGAWVIGNCSGPVLGGAIAQYTTWRWVFYVMFPFCGAGLVLTPWFVRLKPRSATMADKMARFDWLGSLSFTVSATLLLIAISWGGAQYPWGHAATVAPLCIGAIGLLWTVAYECLFAASPFLRLSLFWTISCSAAYVCGMLQGLVIYGQLYYVPLFFRSVKTYSPVQTGLALLPVMVTMVPASIVTGAVVSRTGSYTYSVWVGWTLTTIGSGLTMLWQVHTSIPVWATTLVIVGFGHGAVLSAQNFASQAMSQPGEEGLAAAMYGFLRQFGMALGVAVGTAAFQTSLPYQPRPEGLSKVSATQPGSLATNFSQLLDRGTNQSQSLDAYAIGLRGSFLAFTVISGMALVISLCIKRTTMDRELRTEHTLVERNNKMVTAGVTGEVPEASV